MNDDELMMISEWFIDAYDRCMMYRWWYIDDEELMMIDEWCIDEWCIDDYDNDRWIINQSWLMMHQWVW